ncbi:MAG: iron complex outermembrane receptor protein [Celeribacter sp.]|jgi:iron complex outermembrane receptor protein
MATRLTTSINLKALGVVWVGLMASSALVGAGHAQDVTDLDAIVVENGTLEDGGAVDGYAAATSSAATTGALSRVETPVSVSVVGADQIEDQGASSVVEALRYTAGVFGEYRGTSNLRDEIVMRGFGDRSFVPKSLDGMALGSSAFQLDPYFLERVEAVKGPNSVVSGQATPGGMIAMTSKRPTEDQSNELQLSLGSDNYQRINGDFQGDLNADGSLSYRFVGSAWQKNLQDSFDQSRYMIAPSVKWDISPATTLTVSALYQNEPEAGQRGFLPYLGTMVSTSNGAWIDEDFQSYAPDYDYVNRETKSLGYEVAHELSNGWTLNHKLRWSEVDMEHSQLGLWSSSDDGAGNYPLYVFVDEGTTTSLIGDVSLAGTIETGAVTHNVTLGLDSQRVEDSSAYARSGAVFTYNFADNITPSVADIEAVTLDGYVSASTTTSTQTGIYAQDQFALGQWSVLAGLRYDWAETSTTETYTSEALTGRLGLSYEFDNGLVTYLSYSTSFEPVNQLDTDGNPSYDPTTARQWELGAKWASADDRVFVSAALFDIRKENIVESHTDEGVTITEQIGAVSSKGFELEAQGQVTDRLSVVAAYGYNKGEYETGSNKGNAFYAVPEETASLWLKYDLLEGLQTSVGARYVGTSWNASTNDFQVPDYTLFDAGLSVNLGEFWSDASGVTAQVAVQNLTDERVVTSCVRSYCWLGEGRNWNASLTYEW